MNKFLYTVLSGTLLLGNVTHCYVSCAHIYTTKKEKKSQSSLKTITYLGDIHKGSPEIASLQTKSILDTVAQLLNKKQHVCVLYELANESTLSYEDLCEISKQANGSLTNITTYCKSPDTKTIAGLSTRNCDPRQGILGALIEFWFTAEDNVQKFFEQQISAQQVLDEIKNILKDDIFTSLDIIPDIFYNQLDDLYKDLNTRCTHFSLHTESIIKKYAFSINDAINKLKTFFSYNPSDKTIKTILSDWSNNIISLKTLLKYLEELRPLVYELTDLHIILNVLESLEHNDHIILYAGSAHIEKAIKLMSKLTIFKPFTCIATHKEYQYTIADDTIFEPLDIKTLNKTLSLLHS